MFKLSDLKIKQKFVFLFLLVAATLEAEELHSGHWKQLSGRRFDKNGNRLNESNSSDKKSYAVWIGERVSLAHQSLVHGPAWIGNGTFIGKQL